MGVYLVLWLRGNVWYGNRGGACSIEGRGQVVAHQAGVATFARLRELDLGQQAVALWMKHRSNGHLQLDAELTSRNRRTHQINSKRRERIEGPGARHMLVAQGGKPVVGTDEKIVAGDARRVIEWRPVRLHPKRIGFPKILLLRRQRLPGSDRPAMHSSIIIIDAVSASPLSSHGQREILLATNVRLKRTDIFMHEETIFQ